MYRFSRAGFHDVFVFVFIVRGVDRRECRVAKAKGLIEVCRVVWDCPWGSLPGGTVLERLDWESASFRTKKKKKAVD